MMIINDIFTLGLSCSCPYFTLLLLVNSISPLELFGVVEALEVILTKERAVLGLSAARHAFAEVNPEIVTPPLVAVDSPSRCHLLSSISAEIGRAHV